MLYSVDIKRHDSSKERSSPLEVYDPKKLSGYFLDFDGFTIGASDKDIELKNIKIEGGVLKYFSMWSSLSTDVVNKIKSETNITVL